MNILRGWAYGGATGGVIGVGVFLLRQDAFFCIVCALVVVANLAVLREIRRLHHHD